MTKFCFSEAQNAEHNGKWTMIKMRAEPPPPNYKITFPFVKSQKWLLFCFSFCLFDHFLSSLRKRHRVLRSQLTWLLSVISPKNVSKNWSQSYWAIFEPDIFAVNLPLFFPKKSERPEGKRERNSTDFSSLCCPPKNDSRRWPFDLDSHEKSWHFCETRYGFGQKFSFIYRIF